MVRSIRAVFIAVPAVVVLAAVVTSGSEQRVALPTQSVDCSYLKDPSEFLFSPEKHRLEITNRTKTVTSQLPRFESRAAEAAERIQHRNLIDDYIFNRMEQAGIVSAPLSSDSEFLRRVKLDLTGRIPAMADVESFLTDANPGKRDELIDSLIGSPEFVDKWTMFLGDLLKVNATAANITLYQQGRDAMVRYLRDAVQRNKPYNQIATELITARGNNLFQGDVNWIVGGIMEGPIQDTYDNQASVTASQFLGINVVDCLLCHDGKRHLDNLNLWGTDRQRVEMWGLAAFFSQTDIQRSWASLSPLFSKAIVDDFGRSQYMLDTKIGNRVPRQPLNERLRWIYPNYPFTRESAEPDESYRAALARIMTCDLQFSRAIVNYVWEKIMVVAFVTPSNAFDLSRLDPDNPPPEPWTLQPTNPELLNALAKWFADSGFDLRKLIELIVKSNAYQLSSQYAGTWRAEYVPYYARHYPRRLDAEEIHDAIVQATGVLPNYVMDYTGSLIPLPPVSWAMQFPDTREPRTNNAVVQFLNAFGRGDRDLVPRNRGGSITLGLNLMNNNFVSQRIHANNNGSLVQRLLASTADVREICARLFLSTLGRYATDAEMQAALETMQKLGNTRGAEALQWALLNKVEFIHSY
jgi:hypothetical protein